MRKPHILFLYFNYNGKKLLLPKEKVLKKRNFFCDPFLSNKYVELFTPFMETKHNHEIWRKILSYIWDLRWHSHMNLNKELNIDRIWHPKYVWKVCSLEREILNHLFPWFIFYLFSFFPKQINGTEMLNF